MSRWVALVSCVALLSCMFPARAERSESTAAVLGAVVGFGSGHYYAGDGRAVWYTLGDAGLLTAALLFRGSARPPVVAGLVGLRVFESGQAWRAAKSHNQRHEAWDAGPKPPMSGLAMDAGGFGGWSSADLGGMWAEGGEARAIAAELSAARAAEPRMQLRFDVLEPTVGLSVHSGF